MSGMSSESHIFNGSVNILGSVNIGTSSLYNSTGTNNLIINNNFYPSNNSYTLGSSQTGWNTVYSNVLNANMLTGAAYTNIISQIPTGTIGPTGPAGSGLVISNYVANGKISGNQTVPIGSDVVTKFVADFDPQGWIKNAGTTGSRFQPSIAGYYNISYGVWLTNGTGANQVNIQIRKNTTNTVCIVQNAIPIVTGLSLVGSKLVYLNGTTDYVDFSIFSGSTITLIAQEGTPEGSGTFFSAALMTVGIGPTGSNGLSITGPTGAGFNITNAGLGRLITSTLTNSANAESNLTFINNNLNGTGSFNFSGTGIIGSGLATNSIESIGGTLNIGSNNGSTNTVNLATSSSTQTVNIGTVGLGTTTINIGGPGDTVNVAGNLVYVNSTVTEITNPYFIINQGNSSINNTGIIISKTGPSGSTTGAYFLVNSSSNGWTAQAGSGVTVQLNQDVGTGSNPYFSKVYGGAGSITTPSYTFLGETSSGFYNPSQGIIGTVINNQEKMRITSTGVAISYTGSIKNSLEVGGSIAVGSYAGHTGTENGIIVSGNVGIGTDNPSYQLHVAGAGAGYFGGLGTLYLEWGITGATYYQTSSNTGSLTETFSIFADQSIGALSFSAFSDKRIKTDITPQKDCLSLIEQLNVVNYNLKDKNALGNRKQIGFIAQHTEEIVPEAVKNISEFIPNILSYFIVKKIKNGLYECKATDERKYADIQIGDILKCIHVNKDILKATVLSINSDNILLECNKDLGSVCFVYGKLVHDFKTLEKDVLFTLNIAAVQELLKQQKELIKTIEQTVETVEKVENVVKNQKQSIEPIDHDNKYHVVLDTLESQNTVILGLNEKCNQLEQIINDERNKLKLVTDAVVKLLQKYPIE